MGNDNKKGSTNRVAAPVRPIEIKTYVMTCQNKMSLYLPHVLKEKKSIASIFINEVQKNLSIYDFQYTYSHLNKHIFKDLLEKRIIQLNNKELNEKTYGFYKTICIQLWKKK